MKENIVTFQVAKLAKEKGLQLGSRKSYCHYHKTFTYNGNPNHPESHRKNDVRLDHDFYIVNNAGTPLDISNKHYTIYEAPTQSLLQKWLREVHNIHVWLIPASDTTYRAWYSNKLELDLIKTNHTESFLVYEEALETGLQEALKLI